MVVAEAYASREMVNARPRRAVHPRPPYHRWFLPKRSNRRALGRDPVLIGVVALAVVLVLVVVGAISIGGDEDEGDADTSPLPAPPRAGEVIRQPAIGATIRKPRRWSHSRADRSITLRGPDRTVIMSVSLPPGADRSAAVLQSGVAELRRQYRGVRVVGADRRRVGGLPTNSVVTAATNARGTKLRILTSAPQGRRRAWLVQIFSAAGTKPRRLAEAQVAIGTLRLTG